MTAGEVCNREVVIARPEATVIEAVTLMKNRHVGDVIVVEDRANVHVPIGILTDRDIALALVTYQPTRFHTLRLRDIMSRDVVTSLETESLHEALKKMRSHGVRRLPVVNDDGGLEGILTFDDMIELLSEELTDLAKLVVSEQKRERMPRA
jgi:CBS domain-containing protein